MIGTIAGLALVLAVIAIVCSILWEVAEEKIDYSILREEEQRQRIAVINRTGITRRQARLLVDADVATAEYQLAVARNLRTTGVFCLYGSLACGVLLLVLGVFRVFA